MSDTHCKIRETLLIKDLKPSLNENVSSKKLYLFRYHALLRLRCRFRYHMSSIISFIPLHEKVLQFDLLRAVVFQLNLEYLQEKITNLLRVVPV